MSSGVFMSSRCVVANSRTSAITARWHPSQLSQRCLPSFSTIARCACFQASSLGRGCQLMPARMPRLALAGKPRGVVAIGAGRDYIWAMDDKELDEFAKRFRDIAQSVPTSRSKAQLPLPAYAIARATGRSPLTKEKHLSFTTSGHATLRWRRRLLLLCRWRRRLLLLLCICDWRSKMHDGRRTDDYRYGKCNVLHHSHLPLPSKL